MNKKQKKMLKRIVIAAILFVVFLAVQVILEHVFKIDVEAHWYAFLPWLIPYFIVGYDILLKAFRNIIRGKVFDENFLMMIATFGAFMVNEGAEGCAVMLLYQVGELFQSYAVGKSRKSISELMEIAPEYANLEKDGAVEEVDPDEVHPGDIIVIRPGERVPLDGIVLTGDSFLDTSSLTGESVPRSVREGDEVISGCINQNAVLRVEVTKEYEDSTVSRILELVESASERKAEVENFITRFARYYTPVVTIAAVLLAVIPSVVTGISTGNWGFYATFSKWIFRACTFLVISCPCALVISVPLGFFSGIGAASRIGVLVKGSNFLEAVSDVKTIVFDKTGTLTKGTFTVTEIVPVKGISKDELLEIAAISESYSTHPVGAALKQAYGKDADLSRLENTEEVAGHGIVSLLDGRRCLVGNRKLLGKENVECAEVKKPGTVIYVAVNGEYAGYILISDEIKEGVKDALKAMKRAGIRKTVMLTGDRKEAAEAIAKELKIDTVYADLLPEDKVSRMEEILKAQKDADKVAFAGDGINDAPVLMRADVGIAMGSLGSDAAIEASDIVLMDDDVRKIGKTVKIARKTVRIVHQNIIFALGVKALILVFGALGFANMWIAVFGDVGVAVLAILNSMRAMRISE